MTSYDDLTDLPTLGTAAAADTGDFDAAGAAATAQSAAETASVPASYLDTDGTLAANSDAKVATQKAVRTLTATKNTTYVWNGSHYVVASRTFVGPTDPTADGFTLTSNDYWENT